MSELTPEYQKSDYYTDDRLAVDIYKNPKLKTFCAVETLAYKQTFFLFVAIISPCNYKLV